jgi:beta-glucosidase
MLGVSWRGLSWSQYNIIREEGNADVNSNLEWLYGFGKRFGITAVDMEDGCKRYPKDSAEVLKQIFGYAMAK